MIEPITHMTRSVISGPDTQAAILLLGALSQLRVSGEQTGGPSPWPTTSPGAVTPAGPCPRPG
jgi:hypothetical protein